MHAFLTAPLRGFALAAACWSAGTALAAPPAPPSAAPMSGDPLDVTAPVPPLPDIDAFAGYQSFRDEPVAPWRDSNAAVAPRESMQPRQHHGEHRHDRSPGPARSPDPHRAGDHDHRHHGAPE